MSKPRATGSFLQITWQLKNPNRALDPQNMKPVDPQLPETLN